MSTLYSFEESEAALILTVSNLLHEYGNREILQAAQQRIDAGFTNFVVDLSEAPYMNSVGLNFLITIQSRCSDQGGRVVVANPSNKIIQLLEVTKLLPLFHVTDSVDAAVRAIAETST